MLHAWEERGQGEGNEAGKEARQEEGEEMNRLRSYRGGPRETSRLAGAVRFPAVPLGALGGSASMHRVCSSHEGRGRETPPC